MKINLGGIEFTCHMQNIFADDLPIASAKGVQITKRDAKGHIDIFMSGISDIIEIGAIADNHLEKYSAALSFLNAMKVFLQTGNANYFTDIKLVSETAQIAIDVVKEIALMEVDDAAHRVTIKTAAFSAKKLIAFIGEQA